MANPRHLKILKRGVKSWNRWRATAGGEDLFPDLRGADLKGAELSDANLRLADLSGANLSGASFVMANLTAAGLEGANLSRADLSFAILSHAHLDGANLRQAIFSHTEIGDTDLTNVKGLDTCKHLSPSTIDHVTLSKSGRLPLKFLRGCGLPDTLIEFLPSLLNEPIQFYACFISYSNKDQKFADRLYADLQSKGVRCWLATEDLKIGDRIRTGIDEAIRLHEKLLLVLSKHSIASDWVEQEVETALARERKEKRTVLFPIRLDDAVMKVEGGWPALVRNTRNIGDFRKWKSHDSYQKAFDRLLRDLKAEDKKPSR